MNLIFFDVASINTNKGKGNKKDAYTLTINKNSFLKNVLILSLILWFDKVKNN